MSRRKRYFIFGVLLTLLSFSVSAWASESVINRCLKYRGLVIRESHYYMGRDARPDIIMGQLEQESGCREGVTAFDGGQGLGQFMPGTASWLHDMEEALQEISAGPTPYDPRWSIRAMVLYDQWLMERTICRGRVFCEKAKEEAIPEDERWWYFALRSYNGGLGNLNKEIRRAACCSLREVEAQCRRRVITLRSGSKLDFCKVNIEYPQRIFERSRHYEDITR